MKTKTSIRKPAKEHLLPWHVSRAKMNPRNKTQDAQYLVSGYKEADTRSETAIQREILDNLLKMGAFAWRNSKGVVPIRRGKAIVGVRKADEATNGMPDIFLVVRGRLIGIEVKSLKGKQRPDQVEWQRKMMNAGAVYLLVRSWDEVEEALGSFLKR